MEASLFTKYETITRRAPKHEKAASADEIIKLIGQSKTYDYTYWLRKIGTASFATVMAIVKEASTLEKKYNRGGYITNKLKPYATKRVTTDRRGTSSTQKREGLSSS